MTSDRQDQLLTHNALTTPTKGQVMAESTTWVVLTAAGFLFLYLMTLTSKALFDAILVRLAAFSFVGAGFIGASGWLGGFIDGLVTTTNSTGNEVARNAVGASIVWVAAAGLAIAWIVGILPESWFSGAIPDWLSMSGLILPAFMVSIPGPAGDFLTTVLRTCANLVTGPAQSLFGG